MPTNHEKLSGARNDITDVYSDLAKNVNESHSNLKDLSEVIIKLNRVIENL